MRMKVQFCCRFI